MIKPIRELAEKAAPLGFDYDGKTGKDHLRFRHRDNGRVVVCASTPKSDSHIKVLADMRRIAKLPPIERRA